MLHAVTEAESMPWKRGLCKKGKLLHWCQLYNYFVPLPACKQNHVKAQEGQKYNHQKKKQPNTSTCRLTESSKNSEGF